jgi:adenylylsulfate reductase subunit B
MFNPIMINEAICNGCNNCVEVCPMDIFEANPVKGAPPIVRYPDECAYEGVCWERCPNAGEGAITVIPPLPMRVSILRGLP